MVAVLALAIGACGSAPATPDEKAPAVKAPAAAKAAKPEIVAAPQVVTPPARKLPKTLGLDGVEEKAAEIHATHRVSFFCGCSYTAQMRNIRQSCGYKTRADDSLAHDIVWTRVVPPDAFGAHRTCWTTEACRRDDGSSFGGIECCRRQDPVFAVMEADLNNIVPAIAEVAKDRSDYPFGEVKGEERLYGACDIEVDGAGGWVEPPARVRGDIARIYLYMRAVYGDELEVPAEQWATFEAWNLEDPADAWERERAAAIGVIQAMPNPVLASGAPAPSDGQVGAASNPPEAKPDAKVDAKVDADAKADAKKPDAKKPDAKKPDAKADAKADADAKTDPKSPEPPAGTKAG